MNYCGKPKISIIMTISCLLVLVVVFLPGFFFIKTIVEKSLVDDRVRVLRQVNRDWASRFNSHFAMAEESVQRLAALLSQVPYTVSEADAANFDRIVGKCEDGRWRSIRERFLPDTDAGILLQQGYPISNEIKSYFIQAKRITETFAQSAHIHFVDTWMICKDGGIVEFWPGEPDWIYKAPVDFDYTATDWLTLTNPAKNPNGLPRWTATTFDPGAGIWMISALAPFFKSGEWTGSVGHDLPVNDLMRKVDEVLIYPDTEYMLVRGDGTLLVSNRYQDEIQRSNGRFHMADMAQSALGQVVEEWKEKKIVDSGMPALCLKSVQYVVIANPIEKTGWFFITIVPMSALLHAVREAYKTIWPLLGGVLVLLTLTPAIFITRLVIPPVNRLLTGITRVAKGDLDYPFRPEGTREFNAISGGLGNMATALKKALDDALKARTAIKENEAELRREKEKFKILLERCPFGISLFQYNGTYTYMNPKFTEIFGYTLADIPNREAWFQKAYRDPSYRNQVLKTWDADMNTPGMREFPPRTFRVTCKDGAEKTIQFRGVTIDDNTQYVIYEDVTEKTRLEDQLLQAQKMESIGTLAGGIAHDFNNLLAGIQGRTSMMLATMDAMDPHYDHLQGIETYVQSAASLTRQLLGVARGGKYEVRPTDLNRLIRRTATLFGRTTKEIRIHGDYQEDIWPCSVDRPQIEQVLLNLLVNARQAMPGGGDLFIETRNVCIEQARAGFPVEALGKSIRIRVRDTGIGMNEKIQDRIFDPFFTTKEMGRGTGLGLASAYGIIENHRGVIQVLSSPGTGATFTIYLPASEEAPALVPVPARETKMGEGTILLIDDEEMIVDIGEQMLSLLGYHVLTADSGGKGIAVFTANWRRIDGVVLDMVMPDMSGSVTFDRLKAIDPHVKVLLASGYSIDGQARDILNRGCRGFIQKPFTLNDLSRKVRAILVDSANAHPNESACSD